MIAEVDSLDPEDDGLWESLMQRLIAHIIVLEVGSEAGHPKPLDILQQGIDILFFPLGEGSIVHIVNVPAILQSENDALRLFHKNSLLANYRIMTRYFRRLWPENFTVRHR